MSEGARVRYNPYHDLRVAAGHEAFVKLFNAEEYFVAPQSYTDREYAISARRYAVRFIENLKKRNDCDALVPYTAMTYLDRFLYRSDVPIREDCLRTEERFKLCVFCCFSIAWKYRTKTISFSKFLEALEPSSATQLLQMELNICRSLEWRMKTLTPFNFIEYFIPILNLPPDMPSPRRAVRQLIVKSQFDIAFTVYRPSALAAAAMLTITKHMFPHRHSNCVDSIITTSEFLNPLKDMILQCEQLLDRIYTGDTSIQLNKRQKRINQIPWILRAEEEWISQYRQEKKLAAAVATSTSDIQEVAEDESHHDDDELMDFELGWIDAQANA